MGTPGILSRPRRERIPSLDLGGGNGAPLDVGGTLVLPLEWRRVCWNFLSCSKGVKVLLKFQRLGVISLETPQRKWDSARLEGRTSWIFSSCGRCSRLPTGTSGTRCGGLRKGQSPCELLWVLSGFLSRRCRGLRSCVESVLEPEDSSPVLTWILGDFWRLPVQSDLYSSGGMHVRFPSEL